MWPFTVSFSEAARLLLVAYFYKNEAGGGALLDSLSLCNNVMNHFGVFIGIIKVFDPNFVSDVVIFAKSLETLKRYMM